MDKQIQVTTPNYKMIYEDIIEKKYPQKKELCQTILNKKDITVLDILILENLIFGQTDRKSTIIKQRHRAYNKFDILQILDYQKEFQLSNSQLAKQFKLSRNSISKWKKLFLV